MIDLNSAQVELMTELLNNALRDFKKTCHLSTEDELYYEDVSKCLEYAMKSL